MTQEKEYYAFISYKREDEKWAKWLQDKLEHYRFPTNLNSRTDLPKSIRPTFRDVTDLNPGILTEEINSALRNSEWLIIVCSPRSAKSPWVCKEAQTFIDLGRADHIIPFVIEGNPFSYDVSTECYPEALLNLTGSKELLAANINEMGRDAAAIKVVARMFNLRFDTLWQRYEREQRRKRWMWIGMAIVLAISGPSIGGYFVKQNRIIENQNVQLENAANRLREDSVTLANHVSKIQNDSVQLVRKNDSIILQNALIIMQKTDLDQSNKNLKSTNLLLKLERDNLEKANWEIKKKQARAIAGIANNLIEKGDYYTARLLALEILPTDSLMSDRPYVPESEAVLRKAVEYDNGMVQFGSVFPNEVALNPNRNEIVMADGAILRIVDTTNGNFITEKIDEHLSDEPLFWSPNGEKFAQTGRTSDNGSIIKVWGSKGLSLHIYDLGTDKRINCSTFSKDSKSVIYAEDSIVYQYNLSTQKKDTLLYGHADEVNQINLSNYSKHNKVVTASSDKTIKIWDSVTGVLYNTLMGHSNDVKYALFSKDDSKIISADDRKIIVWDSETGDSLYSFLTNEKISCLSLGSNNRYFVSVNDGIVTSYNIENGEKTGSVHDRYYKSWIYNRSGNGMSTSSDDILRFYNGRSKYEYPYIGNKHKSFVHDVSFSPDGNRIISASDDSTIIIWNTRAYRQSTIAGHMGPVTSARYSPNGETIASSSRDSTLRIWDAKRLDSVYAEKFPSAMTCVSYSPDGKFLTVASENGHLYIYSTMLWEKIKEIDTYTKGIYSAVMSSDGKRILSLSLDKQIIKLWDIEKEICIDSITGRNDLRRIAWSPDEKYIAIQVQDSILLWNIQSKSLVTRWRAPGLNIAFCPNGRWIVNSDSNLPSVFLWDALSGTLIKAFKGHAGFMGGIAFSLDGNKVVTDYSSSYGKNGFGIEVWTIEPLNEIIQRTRKRFEKRKISEGERKQYYLE